MLQDIQQIVEGVAAVQNILHHNHVAAGDILRQVLDDLNLPAGGGAAAVGGHGHEVHLEGHVDGPHEIAGEDGAASQNGDDHDTLGAGHRGVISRDVLAHLAHAVGKILLGEENLRNVVMHVNHFLPISGMFPADNP